MNKNKHLVFDERYVIEHSLNKNMSFKAIGKQILKDCTTVSKEVKAHIIFEKKGAPYRPFNDCLNRKHCFHYGDICLACERHKNRNKCSSCGHCTTSCADYSKEECPKLSKAPYVCNGCDLLNSCTLEKRFYKALSAQKEYELVRSESRSGFNLCEDELKQLDSVISPYSKTVNLSITYLLTIRTRFPAVKKPLIFMPIVVLFSARNIDMPRKVRFKPRKKQSVPLKVDKSCRIGRTYDDYKLYRMNNPSLPVAELDSVEGIKGGSVLLTIHFVLPKLQLAFLREANDSKSVTDIFDHLYE